MEISDEKVVVLGEIVKDWCLLRWIGIVDFEDWLRLVCIGVG